MSRGQITKDEMKVLILNQKNKINCEHCSDDKKEFAHQHLNQLLDRLDEFRI